MMINCILLLRLDTADNSRLAGIYSNTNGGYLAPASLLRLEDIQQELFDITRGHLVDVLRWHFPSTNLQLMFHSLNNPPNWNMGITRKFKKTHVNNWSKLSVQSLMQYIHYLMMWTCYFYYLGSCCETGWHTRHGSSACHWTAQGCWRWSSQCGWQAPAAARPLARRGGCTCCIWCPLWPLETAG